MALKTMRLKNGGPLLGAVRAVPDWKARRLSQLHYGSGVMEERVPRQVETGLSYRFQSRFRDGKKI
jgi:hypothetical protein